MKKLTMGMMLVAMSIIATNASAINIIDAISFGSNQTTTAVQPTTTHSATAIIVSSDSLYRNTTSYQASPTTKATVRVLTINKPIVDTTAQEIKPVMLPIQAPVQVTQNTLTTSIAPQVFILPSWFMSGFTSSQLIGQIALYGRDGQYTAINHSTNTILFQTTSGQTLESSTTGDNGSTIMILGGKDLNQPNRYTNGLNSKSLYIINQNDIAIATGAHTIMMIASGETDNQWGQSVIIVASFTTGSTTYSDWNYVVYNHAGQILKSGMSGPTTVSLRQLGLTNPGLIKPVTPPVYIAPQPVVTTPQALSYNIHYTLGTQDTQGYYTLKTASCTTNGSMDVLWIEKRLGQNYFGIGIEINNTFGIYTYQVKKGDRLCCKVSTTSGPYQKAGGCEEIK